jgi:phosphonopyruvate decarboxylase
MPGVADEPQHRLQGKTLEALLTTLHVPFRILPDQPGPAAIVIDEICSLLDRPRALLVRPGTLAEQPAAAAAGDSRMTRAEALRQLLTWLPPQTVIFATTDHTCRELYALRRKLGQSDVRDFLNVGAMGHTAALALGFARRQPELEVVCLDGEGALLMHLGTLATIGRQAPANFTHILLNNGVHDSVGAQPVANPDADFSAIAAACGYRSLQRCNQPEALADELAKLWLDPGPRWLEIQITPGSPPHLPRPAGTPQQRVIALQQSLSRSAENSLPEST